VAVEKLEGVTNVSTDMDAHTLTLTLDDEKQSLEAVVEALADAGYVARHPKKLVE
jgi:copper chaperone CopZ